MDWIIKPISRVKRQELFYFSKSGVKASYGGICAYSPKSSGENHHAN
jgi:hypothetical protein